MLYLISRLEHSWSWVQINSEEKISAERILKGRPRGVECTLNTLGAPHLVDWRRNQYGRPAAGLPAYGSLPTLGANRQAYDHQSTATDQAVGQLHSQSLYRPGTACSQASTASHTSTRSLAQQMHSHSGPAGFEAQRPSHESFRGDLQACAIICSAMMSSNSISFLGTLEYETDVLYNRK